MDIVFKRAVCLRPITTLAAVRRLFFPYAPCLPPSEHRRPVGNNLRGSGKERRFALTALHPRAAESTYESRPICRDFRRFSGWSGHPCVRPLHYYCKVERFRETAAWRTTTRPTWSGRLRQTSSRGTTWPASQSLPGSFPKPNSIGLAGFREFPGALPQKPKDR